MLHCGTSGGEEDGGAAAAGGGRVAAIRGTKRKEQSRIDASRLKGTWFGLPANDGDVSP